MEGLEYSPSRSKDAPVLSWVADGGVVYIEIDCVPKFTDTHSGQVTDFALEDGSSIADSFIQKPHTITLDIAQTTVGSDLDLPEAVSNFIGGSPRTLETVELNLEPNKFRPSGLLLATVAITGAINSGLSLIGLGASQPAPLRVTVVRDLSGTDRINKLYDELERAFNKRAKFTLIWLGRTWENYIAETIGYTRSGSRELGEFSVSLKKISIVTTEQATAVQVPAELTMKAPVSAGNVPGKKVALSKGTVKSNPSLDNPALASEGL